MDKYELCTQTQRMSSKRIEHVNLLIKRVLAWIQLTKVHIKKNDRNLNWLHNKAVLFKYNVYMY